MSKLVRNLVNVVLSVISIGPVISEQKNNIKGTTVEVETGLDNDDNKKVAVVVDEPKPQQSK